MHTRLRFSVGAAVLLSVTLCMLPLLSADVQKPPLQFQQPVQTQQPAGKLQPAVSAPARTLAPLYPPRSRDITGVDYRAVSNSLSRDMTGVDYIARASVRSRDIIIDYISRPLLQLYRPLQEQRQQ